MSIIKSLFAKFKLKKVFHYLALALIILMSISITGDLVRLRETNYKIEESKKRLDKLKKENQELKLRVDKVQTEEFIEKQARDKLGLAKEGEIVVVLPDSETLKRIYPKIKEDEETLPDPNWKKWLKLFF